MINFNSQIPSVTQQTPGTRPHIEKPGADQSRFAEQVKEAGKAVAKVDDLQQHSDASIQDLLSGKNNDITSVVSDVAKADMSFKLLVGVRNKLIEAYKQTMNMQL